MAAASVEWASSDGDANEECLYTIPSNRRQHQESYHTRLGQSPQLHRRAIIPQRNTQQAIWMLGPLLWPRCDGSDDNSMTAKLKTKFEFNSRNSPWQSKTNWSSKCRQKVRIPGIGSGSLSSKKRSKFSRFRCEMQLFPQWFFGRYSPAWKPKVNWSSKFDYQLTSQPAGPH